MPARERVSIEQIVEAYRATGSVWKCAKQLGLCGQSVWERAKVDRLPNGISQMDYEEDSELALLAEQMPIGRIAEHLEGHITR